MAADDTDRLDDISLNMEGLEDDDEEETSPVGDAAAGKDDDLADDGSDVKRPARPVLTERMLARKADFERERDEILGRVPKHAKDRFGKIYMAKFGKYYGPVLVMNPYRVPPGQVRDTWLSMFHKVSASSGRVSRLAMRYAFVPLSLFPVA